MRKITFLFLSLFIAASAMAIENVTTGYYHLIGRDTNRSEHLYNNALHSGNSMKFTLQSNSMVNTNNGIWYVTVKDNNKLGIKNGDGNPVVAGANWGGSIAGSFTELTIAGTADVNDFRYYYFKEALNCTNGSVNFKIGGADFLTTWSNGGSANDNQWRFEPVDMEGKSVYDVVVEGDHDVYVTYDGGYAFNGGFFITASSIDASDLSVGIVGNVLKGADVKVEGNTIKVTNVQALATPVKQDLYNTSKGDGVIPPYRIPGITTASNGRLITAAARLVCGTDPGYGQVDVVCRTSDDHGATWSDMIDVAVGTGRTSATVNYFDTAFGDPAIVADRTSNEVLIIAVAGCTVYMNGNTTRQNPNLIATIHSKDNGETWEAPVNATEQIYSLFDEGNVVQSAFVGGGKVFQSRIVKKDKYYRLYAAMCARPNGNRVIYSDDFGRTWHALGGASALPAPGGDEPKCEEMPDGRVILSSRVGGGRIYNIYTYSNTLTGEGSWSTDVKSTFAGSGLTPGGNSTNGEILIVPVQRNSDKKEMYLALQSLPTGGGRTNVGIFYKELTDVTDLNTVANFAADWNGFFQVSNTSSAYSSMDLQADDRIGFIYEETLTGFGRRDNPVSTSFPNGEGQHNFDGFDNIYVAYELEYITNGAYSVKRDVDRRAFLKEYFTELVSEADVDVKADVESAIENMSEIPTIAEIDEIYALMAENEPADEWDGMLLAFTNVQQTGTSRTLYINEHNQLALSTSSPADLGGTALFRCKKEVSGKYSFYNEEKDLYMIWRGKGEGYNDDIGTLDTYNAAYCDWSINSGSVADRYYLVSKRSNGTTDGSLIILASGAFDAWSAGEGYSSNYSNLFRIEKNFGGYLRVRRFDDRKSCMVSVGTNGARASFSTTAEKKNTIFYYEGNSLLSYASGLYLVSANTNRLSYTNSATATAANVAIVAGNEYDLVQMCVANRYMYSNNSNGTIDGGTFSNGFNSTDNNYRYVVEHIATLPVTITSAGYATFYAPVAVELPEGVTAHTITINGKWATLSDAFSIVPAKTGVILAGKEGDYNFEIVKSAPIVESVLQGSVAASYVTEEAYVLGKYNGEVGLYKAEMKNGQFLNNGHKAYLPANAVPNKSVAFYGFDWDGTTCIDEVKTENGTNGRHKSNVKGIYDLTGRKVEAIAAPGIYIIDGKKVLVK